MMICTRSISVSLALFLPHSFVFIPSKINTTELGDALLYDFFFGPLCCSTVQYKRRGEKKNFDTKTQIHINKHVYALNARAGEKMWIFFQFESVDVRAQQLEEKIELAHFWRSVFSVFVCLWKKCSNFCVYIDI